MSQFVVPVIYGSVRTARQGIRAARFVVAQLEKRDIQAVLVDPMERPLPLLDRMYKEFPKGEAPPVMEALSKLFYSADGFAIVSGEYNHGIPPALKNLLDHFLEEYFFRPAAITTYSGGRWGGAHAAMQLAHVARRNGNGDDADAFSDSDGADHVRYERRSEGSGNGKVLGGVFR